MSPSKLVHSESKPGDWRWPFWFITPLYPFGQRRTLRREVVRNTVWTFDQLQGILYTIVPIRMTIVKLDAGGLLVYSPVAPTRECLRLVNELVAEHGDVKYIILSTSSGLEHKVFAGPFARRFTSAQVFVAPDQWSFPVNLPLPWLGFPRRRTQILPDRPPFADEFDCAVLNINLGRGSFVEVALHHRRSQTLLLTDTVLSISSEPPAIAQLDPYPLLFHARDRATDRMEDTAANRRKGWQRIALFAIYFRPDALQTIGLGTALKDAVKAPDRSLKAYFGLYPFEWRSGWEQSFTALSDHGRPFVAPILQTLILPQGKEQVLQWVDRICRWNFQHIISAHFDAPINATPEQVCQAFAFFDLADERRSLPECDMQFIKNLEENLIRRGIATPRP